MCSLHQHWNLVKQHWGGPLRALPTGLIDKLRPLTLFACWHCFAAMPHHQSVLSALDESQSDLNHEAGGRSGKQRPQFSPHTDSGQKNSVSSLSKAVNVTVALLSVIDDRGSAYFWSWHVLPLLAGSPLCSILFTLFVLFLWPPQLSSAYGRGFFFSMPSVVQVCVTKSWVLFWKPWEFQSFSHLRFFFKLPHLRLPSHPLVLP